jgi:RNA:NAD 2'-phosphotransferase (TPT1/KptA family)
VFGTSYLYIAEPAFTTTIADTDADDVAIMSIESEGNFNKAMANMLRGSAGVVSLRNNKDSFNEVEDLLAQCKGYGNPCSANTDCCEYK